MDRTGFIAWALDPQRTDDEAYFAERAVEFGLGRWQASHHCTPPGHYETMSERHKRRRLNPAHRVTLDKLDVEHAAEKLAEHTDLYLSCSSDRPLRDISVVRFFPHLRTLDISHTEITDLTPLSALPQLERFSIADDTVEDLRPLSALTRLRYLTVYCHRPWPRVDGLDALQKLEELRWSGNLLVLEGFGAFPCLREVNLSNTRFNLPLRDATRLPAMPALELLALDTLNRLDGLQRYPTLRNLTVGGRYRDLTPLTSLPGLTHVDLTTTEALDLAPLCQLPELRCFKLRTEHPCDLFALTDAPKLREVVVEGCDANTRDVPTLQAVLSSWDTDFLAPQPRPLGPMRYAVQAPVGADGRSPHVPKDTDAFHGDKGMQSSESRWFRQRLNAALERATGDPHWGSTESGWLAVYSLAAAERLPELFEVIRRVMAECRYPHALHLNTSLKAESQDNDEDWRDPDEIEAEQEKAERESWKEERRQEAEFREREYRLRQLRQEGIKINPQEFAPPPEPSPAEADDEDDDDTPVDIEGDEPHALADEYAMYGILNEEGFFAAAKWVDACERVLGRKLERQG